MVKTKTTHNDRLSKPQTHKPPSVACEFESNISSGKGMQHEIYLAREPFAVRRIRFEGDVDGEAPRALCDVVDAAPLPLAGVLEATRVLCDAVDAAPRSLDGVPEASRAFGSSLLVNSM